MIASTARQLRLTGTVCLLAGLLGAASGLLMLAVAPEVPETRYSYPFGTGAFIAAQAWFAVQHLGLLAGQWGLRASGAGGSGRAIRWGHWTGLVGMGLLTVTEVIAIAAAEDPYPSDLTSVLDGLYGLSTIGVGVGLTVVGVGVLRRHQWTSWRRWVPFAIGVWVFIPMTPAIMAGYVPARLSITAWMLLYAALGLALMHAANVRPQRDVLQAPMASR